MKQPNNNNSDDKYNTLNKKDSDQFLTQVHQVNVFNNIDDNFNFLKKIFGNAMNLIEGKYFIFDGTIQAGIVYINNLVDKKFISGMIVKPLLEAKTDADINSDDILTIIQTRFIYVPNINTTTNMGSIIDELLNGDTILFFNNVDTALIIGSRNIEKRAIEKPENEVTVFASQDSFIEDLDTNCSMVIRRLPIPNLKFEEFKIGTLSQTKVKLLWIEGVANTKVVDMARQRIQKIKIDNLVGIGELGELIEDRPLSIFPKYRQTQRPDTTARYLATGAFAVLCGNSPFAILAPMTLWDNFRTMDDYTERTLVSSFLRLVRYAAFILATTVSPLYLSFVTYNHSIVPPALAINIATGRAGVPFPSVVELLVMTFSIAIIREASLRIPGSVGYFVGTIAAIVIGQAAVSAGYVSASLIIVVAIAAISSFAMSSTALVYPVRLINYSLILLSSLFGMFGLINGVIIIVWHLVSLESFGVPYLYPLVPFDLEGMKDTFIRVRLSALKKRLRLLAPFNRNRIGN